MSNLILSFPFLVGSLEMGIPSFSITISRPGLMISDTLTGRSLPSKVMMVRVLPVRASNKEILWFMIRSFPSLLKTGCGFSSITKIRSPGLAPVSWFPFSGKVIFVPFFQPGLMFIANTSSTVTGLLQQ